MKSTVLILACVFSVFGCGQTLSPTAEFNLSTVRNNRSFLEAGANGLTFLSIGDSGVRWVSADLNGKIQHTRSDLASINAYIYSALPLPDGGFWLISSGPHPLAEDTGASGHMLGNALPSRPMTGQNSSGSPAYYNELDLYSSAGEHVQSMRLLSQAGGWESPIAASASQIVLLSALRVSRSQLIHFGDVADGSFREKIQVRLRSPVAGALAVFGGNGDLFLIAKSTGSMVVIDPKTKGGSVVPLGKARKVQAAAADSGYLYLLAGGDVVKADFGGTAVATYQLRLKNGFMPVSLGVTGNMLYLADRMGRTERFQTN